MEQKIEYKNLSGPLKMAVIISFTIGILYAITFLIGFIIGITETT